MHRGFCVLSVIGIFHWVYKAHRRDELYSKVKISCFATGLRDNAMDGRENFIHCEDRFFGTH